MTVNHALPPLTFIQNLLQMFLFPPSTPPQPPLSSCDLMPNWRDLLSCACGLEKEIETARKNDWRNEVRRKSDASDEGGSLLMMIFRPYSFLCPTHLVSFLSCFSQPTSHITWCQVYRKWITSCHKSARPFNLNTCMLACDPHKTALNLTETLWFIYSV